MTVFNRVVSDHTGVSDDAPATEQREYCWTGHVHIMAYSMEDARMKLARYFDNPDKAERERVFSAGQMTLGPALIVHQPQADMSVEH